MSDIDLDINNYTNSDIERFFKLDPKKKYTYGDVEMREYEIREQLLSSGHVDKKFKRDLIELLKLAKDKLLPRAPPTDVDQPVFQSPDSNQYKQSRTSTTIGNSRIENELITREEREFKYSAPSEFYQGTLNPLNTRVVSKCVSIDTRFRDNFCNTKSSDFTIQLPSKLNKVVSMQLSAIEFPMKFYAISASYGNNYLYIYANTQPYLDGPVEQFESVVIVPDGNYTADSLINKINALLAPLDASGNLLNPASVYSYIQLTLDTTCNTGKVTIGPSATFPNILNSIGLDFKKGINGKDDTSDITTKLGWNLGFTKVRYFGSLSYISDTAVDMHIMRYVYLGIDDYQRSVNNLFFHTFNDKPVNENVLARISMNSPSFTVLMANNLSLITEPRRYFGPVDIQRLRVQLFDDHGRPLDIHNANYSFVLNFKLLYDL